MRMHGMCLLTMNDTQPGVGAARRNHCPQTGCHHCQQAAVNPSTACGKQQQHQCSTSSNMVCNLALLTQGAKSPCLATNGGASQKSQIAFIPIRISPDRGIQPIDIHNLSDLTNNATDSKQVDSLIQVPITTTSGGSFLAVKPAATTASHHCPCCPFQSNDSGFCEIGCNACAKGTHTAIQGGCDSNRWKNNNHRPQYVHCTCNVRSSPHRMDLLHHCQCVSDVKNKCFSSSHLICNCGKNSSMSKCEHSGLFNHHPAHLVQNMGKTDNLKGSLSDQNIPNVILKSPKDDNPPSILILGQNSSSSACPSLKAPELFHSKSQDDNTARHQELCQMAGGNLMPMDTFPKHRHSTGNTYENLNFGDEFKLTGQSLHTNSWSGGKVSCNTPSSSSSSDHSCHKTISPTLRQSTTSPALVSTMWSQESCGQGSSSLSHSSSSGQFQYDDESCTSWPDEFSDLRVRGLSSSSSSGDSSGSSVASWAQNFIGAAANETNWKTLNKSTKHLDKCGFYYEHMSMEQAKLRLKPLPVGSFLLRDSAHKHFLYSLSTKTTRGVTSVRIEYKNSTFILDSEEKAQAKTPGFDCIIKLIQHYVNLSESKRKNNCVWLESSGRKDTPVLLTRPAFQGPQSLAHMCRKVIHRNIDLNKLSQHLKTDHASLQYLKEYPYYV